MKGRISLPARRSVRAQDQTSSSTSHAGRTLDHHASAHGKAASTCSAQALNCPRSYRNHESLPAPSYGFRRIRLSGCRFWAVTLFGATALPQYVVTPSGGAHAISMTKPPPHLSCWKESKSIPPSTNRRKCGYDPLNPLTRNVGMTTDFSSASIDSRADAI